MPQEDVQSGEKEGVNRRPISRWLSRGVDEPLALRQLYSQGVVVIGIREEQAWWNSKNVR
jgi:hypothetical protein